MLCVTGSEQTGRELAARLRTYQNALQEVRLDLVQDLDESIFALLRGPRILVTCRSAAEGGGFRGSENERLALLTRALREQPEYLDVELAVPAATWQELLRSRGATRLICSHHALQVGTDLHAIARALAAVPAQLHKLAVMVQDAAELLALLELHFDTPLVRIGMGAAGLLSRALPARFDSPWSYAHAEGTTATAPGQLSVKQAEAWRINSDLPLQPFVLVGAEQVLHSPGPSVYNRLFGRRGLPYIYLPVISRRPPELLQLLERLGAGGASVTMPLKESMLPLLDELSPPADRIGAVNTIRFDARTGRRHGWNSDGPAIGALCGNGAGQSALVLGAGGAGRAAARTLLDQGWVVRLSDIDGERCQALARQLDVAALPWHECASRTDRLLLNATPCGSDGQTDPIPERSDFRDAVVLDMVLSGKTPTPLLRRAAAAGARVISGLHVWLEQGARQMSWLTGLDISSNELAECLDD